MRWRAAKSSKQADVVTERRPRAEVGRDLVADREQAIGLAARNALQPGQVLRTADTDEAGDWCSATRR